MPDWYSVAPDCIKTGDLGAGFENLASPFADCTGYFTFGGGRVYAGAPFQPFPEGAEVGDLVSGGSTALYIITAIGFAVSIAFFVAWVWFENRKLVAQAGRLRAAAGGPLGGPSTSPQPGTSPE